MRMLAPILLFAAIPAVAAPAEQESERAFAWRATRAGKLLPLKEIERRVIPTMKGAQYIGFNLDTDSAVYTLKFLRDGEVIWVDVDGRSGQVLGRTGR
ncbi:hypothetical protein HRV97_01800 [Sphingomonas sp. HHU CXW]|uniref:PepSY domain-containing protein n=2 Tax=Sphingomonas hominis TaxID=2741495 RepID=A0ABX2JE61_9SPHN|nr:hypothetical protein [Sphingomonas hominis]